MEPYHFLQYTHPDHPGYEIDTRRERVDVAVAHDFLSKRSYWSPGLPRQVLERAIAGSLVWGIYQTQSTDETRLPTNGALVGFARVVTDQATFAWLADVFVLEAHRGTGLSKWLVSTIQSHPGLQGLRKFMLGTRDAHGLYAQKGFRPLANPTRYMEIARPNIYQEPPFVPAAGPSTATDDPNGL